MMEVGGRKCRRDVPVPINGDGSVYSTQRSQRAQRFRRGHGLQRIDNGLWMAKEDSHFPFPFSHFPRNHGATENTEKMNVDEDRRRVMKIFNLP